MHELMVSLPRLLERNIQLLLLSLLIFASAWSYAASHYRFPSLPLGGVQGTAHVKIQSLHEQHLFFGKRWIYQMEIQQFFPKGESSSIAALLPCSLICSQAYIKNHGVPLANQDYLIQGILSQRERGSHVSKPSKMTPWKAAPSYWNLAEWRQQWKEKVRQWIENNCPYPKSASFLTGLAIGDFDDHWMRQQFNRFGIQIFWPYQGFILSS